MDFPMPFGGIRLYLEVQPRKALADFLQHVADGCGKDHDHNIAVAFDGNRIYGSKLLFDCFHEWLEGYDSPEDS